MSTDAGTPTPRVDELYATEIAERNRYANTTFGDLSNAFLEQQSELEQANLSANKWYTQAMTQSSAAEQRVAELAAELEQEREAVEYFKKEMGEMSIPFATWLRRNQAAMRARDEELEQERKAREEAQRCDNITKTAFDKLADKCDALRVINLGLAERAAETAISYQAALNECKLANQRAADLQARLDRVERENRELKEGWRQAKSATEAETIERCAQICWEEGAYRAKRSHDPMAGDDSGVQGHKSITAYMLANQIRALAAAGGQDSAATQSEQSVQAPSGGQPQESAPAADPALPGLELAADICDSRGSSYFANHIRAEIAKRTK